MKLYTCSLLFTVFFPSPIHGFTAFRSRPLKPFTRSRLYTNVGSAEDPTLESSEADQETRRISSLLKFFGPYPSLALRFPALSTSAQRDRNVTGISLDFVLDTAANTNTINAQVANELQLDNVGSALPGFGASGAIDGGDTYLLGNCTLDLPNKELFMTDLTASALPVASPATAGLLGVGFLNCFEGGVKFEWGGGISGGQPMVTFYGDESDAKNQIDSMTRIPIDVIDKIFLPSVMMNINGVEIPALLDTGSPVTVLNAPAADLAGLTSITLESDNQKEDGGFNPFKKFSDNLKATQSLAQAVSTGDILVVGGSDGQQIQLRLSTDSVKISLGSEETISFPSTRVYIGDLPGLKAIEGMDESKPTPAAVLGMDVLKRLPTMFYRGVQNEVYF